MPSGHSALRRGRVSLPGCTYLITFTTHGRAPLFHDSNAAACACRAITDYRLWRRSILLAWVLMPDHWHGLVHLGAGETLPHAIGRLETNSARQVRACLDPAPRIWAPAFHDRALRRDESLAEAARYILMNPVRAGLAADPGKYPYWDAIWIRNDPCMVAACAAYPD